MWPSLVKIYRTKVIVRKPVWTSARRPSPDAAIPNHILRSVSRWAYKKEKIWNGHLLHAFFGKFGYVWACIVIADHNRPVKVIYCLDPILHQDKQIHLYYITTCHVLINYTISDKSTTLHWSIYIWILLILCRFWLSRFYPLVFLVPTVIQIAWPSNILAVACLMEVITETRCVLYIGYLVCNTNTVIVVDTCVWNKLGFFNSEFKNNQYLQSISYSVPLYSKQVLVHHMILDILYILRHMLL